MLSRYLHFKYVKGYHLSVSEHGVPSGKLALRETLAEPISTLSISRLTAAVIDGHRPGEGGTTIIPNMTQQSLPSEGRSHKTLPVPVLERKQNYVL